MDVQENPWLVDGDFNVILSKEENLGGLPFTQHEATDFSLCLNACAFEDINFFGSKYTWWNRRVAEDCIFKRVDKILANSAFL